MFAKPAVGGMAAAGCDREAQAFTAQTSVAIAVFAIASLRLSRAHATGSI